MIKGRSTGYAILAAEVVALAIAAARRGNRDAYVWLVITGRRWMALIGIDDDVVTELMGELAMQTRRTA